VPFITPQEEVLVGLPDTVWFPEDGFCRLGSGLSFLLFQVERPQLFDVVVTDDAGSVREIQVKPSEPKSDWIWGAFKLTGRILADLHELWVERSRKDEYVGTLVNAWLLRGGRAQGVRAGEAYVDVGTLHGYRHAIQLLAARQRRDAAVGIL
jgi:dTDP-glucose pyrophosphorylase